MPGLTIGWEYLTGSCVATDPASRQRAEWPPHPGRVFMALAAAWFETGKDSDEGNALRWLEKLNEPEMILPARNRVFPRDVVTTFVPVNGDRAGDTFPDKAAGTLQSANAIARIKQPRTRPSIWVGDAPCFLRWPDAVALELDEHQAALDGLASKVTRIGHSSSLVRMWLEPVLPTLVTHEHWTPIEGQLGQFACRNIKSVSLDRLPDQTGIPRIEEFARLVEILESTDKSAAAKKMREVASDQYVRSFGKKWKKFDRPPDLKHPQLGLWSSYQQSESVSVAVNQRTDFDNDLLVLTKQSGSALPLVSTLAVTRCLRGAVMKHSSIQPPPSWVSGHQQAGEPVRDGKQHLAILPLPNVGHDRSDGHLLGLALAFPRWVLRRDRGQILGPMLVNPSGESRSVELQLGALGTWTLSKRDWSEPRRGLKPETWTANPGGARTWASVTPVVLDGFPKEDQFRDRSAWHHEVVAMLARACQRIGLPEPVHIEFGTTSWHVGSPRATQKRRLLRGHPELSEASAAIGDGFPPYPAKATTGIRPQFHVCLQFSKSVVGPIILGAGRFLGYGLCKPILGGPGQ